jgi:hypothetical protein
MTADSQQWYTTAEVAKLAGVHPQSIRNRLSVKKAYAGVEPAKYFNGELRWPKDQIDEALKPKYRK